MRKRRLWIVMGIIGFVCAVGIFYVLYAWSQNQTEPVMTAEASEREPEGSAEPEAVPPAVEEFSEAEVLPEMPDESNFLKLAAGLFYDAEQGRLLAKKHESIAFGEPERNYFYDSYSIKVDAASEIVWESGHWDISDNFITALSGEDGVIRFQCPKPHLLSIGEDDFYTYIALQNPRELYDRIILIDPGHGGDDFGAVTKAAFEKDINLDIAKRLFALFEGDESTLALLTRVDDSPVAKEDRSILANAIGDYFISIHNNVDERNASSHGTITYYYAEEEEDFPSRTFAEYVQEALTTRLGTRDRGLDGNSPYRVLLNTKIPAVLTEILFMSNPDELALIIDPDYRQQVAEALYEALTRLP